MGAQENEFQISLNDILYYTWNFQNFTCVFTIVVKFGIHFLGLPWEIVFGVTKDNELYP